MSPPASTSRIASEAPLIVHVVYRFDVGGLENGVVNLINGLPREAYRHTIVALTEATSFRNRIQRDDVQFVELHKGPGHAIGLYARLVRLFRDLEPAIVHTRNLAALEAVVPAWLARVPARVHGEHGRDVGDVDGSSRKYQRIRRLYRPFVSRYIALSNDLKDYLCDAVGVRTDRVSQIYNGVDTALFTPAVGGRAPIDGCPFTDANLWLVGTVGRMEEVKDHLTLAQAFVAAQRADSQGRRLRLVIVGDGATRKAAEDALTAAGMRDLAWLPGERADIPAAMRGLDCFVLPSLAEGISNTILEAMASGLPVVATSVGGNPELVLDGVSGRLVPAASVMPMAAAIGDYARDPALARRHGRAGRQVVLQRFSLDRMIEAYRQVYDDVLRSANFAADRAA